MYSTQTLPTLLRLFPPPALDTAVFTPGMFRVTANLTEVRELLSRCDDGQTACIAECDDNHLLGGLLLEALKDLPRSLLEFEAVVALERKSTTCRGVSGGKERDTKPIVAPQPTTLCVFVIQYLPALVSQSRATLQTLGGV